jgi:hypothetical protein
VHAEYASEQVLGVLCAPAEFTTDATANSPATITKTLRMLEVLTQVRSGPHSLASNRAAFHDRLEHKRCKSHRRIPIVICFRTAADDTVQSVR